MFFSILLVELRQYLAVAVPGLLDHHGGLRASVQVPVTGDRLRPCCAGLRAPSRHRGIKLTACMRVVSHIQGPLK